MKTIRERILSKVNSTNSFNRKTAKKMFGRNYYDSELDSIVMRRARELTEENVLKRTSPGEYTKGRRFKTVFNQI